MSYPNAITMTCKEFYISYNSIDFEIYGGVTTALVKGNMEKFYILLGDHRPAYAKLFPQGFDACLAYYKENLAKASNRSDSL